METLLKAINKRIDIVGIAFILLISSVLGLISNHINGNGIPLIRKPLRQTRRFIKPVIKKVSVSSGKPAAGIINNKKIQIKNETVKEAVKAPEVPLKKQMSVAPKPVKTVAAMSVKNVEKEEKAQALFINISDAKGLYDRGAVFVDARPKEDYNNIHVKGAVSLYEQDVEANWKSVLKGISDNKEIITYCSDPECSSAMKLADALVSKGFKRVYVFMDGLPAWQDRGYPVAINE